MSANELANALVAGVTFYATTLSQGQSAHILNSFGVVAVRWTDGPGGWTIELEQPQKSVINESVSAMVLAMAGLTDFSNIVVNGWVEQGPIEPGSVQLIVTRGETADFVDPNGTIEVLVVAYPRRG